MKIGVIRGNNIKIETYAAAVTAAGGEVVVLDPYRGALFDAKLLDGLGGLVIPGGGDILPSYYNEENIACKDLDPERDDFEMKAVEAAVNQKLPVLGICRGMQLLNVYFGGSLYQNIFCCAFHKKFEGRDRIHETKVEPYGFIYEIYKNTKICVNSAHHQAVKKLAECLVPAQYSTEGLLEAFSHRDLPIYAVQWHPERMCLENARKDTEDGLKVFQFFIRKCENT